MKVIVVGGGASGLVSAIKLAKKGIDVTILEKNDKCGKKLLLTGNGHCNYWNNDQTLDKYYTSNPRELEIIWQQKNQEVLKFFDELGIIPKIKNGYYYPFANQSISIVNALLNAAKHYKVKIIYNTTVKKITKKTNFIITTNNGLYESDKIIIATGGKSYPKTGSTGDGYELAQSLGHTIIEVLPALVKIKSNNKICKKLQGIRCDVKLSLYENNKFIKEEDGELQFTADGLSGICIFNLSRIISRGLYEKKQEIVKINFLPWLNKDFINWIKEQSKLRDYASITNILEGCLNYKIVNEILKECHINRDSIIKEIENNKLLKLQELLVNYPIIIGESYTFLEAQVSTGGIPLTEINPYTMESLKVDNLYFVGEILDVDGICGGYNLGFAWMSALCVADNINIDKDVI